MSRYLAYCPHFLDSDRLVFHKDIFIKDTRVIDRGLGLQHELLPQASPLLYALTKSTSYAHLCQLAAKYTTSQEQLHELLGFFVASGCLIRNRSLPQKVRAAILAVRDSLYGIGHHSLLQRQANTTVNLLKVIVIAARAPLLCGLAVLISWMILGVNNKLIIASWYAFGTFWISLLIHELGHCILLNHYNTRSVLLYSPLRIGLLHSPLEHNQDLRTALIGPVMGIISCIVLALTASTISKSTLAAGACLGICLVHCCSFLPWYGDGKSIWRKQT